jgi:hypothetical protein
MLIPIKNNFPLIYPFLYQSYRFPSLLFFGNKTISSEVGVQQGDPCGPMSFSITVQPLVNNLLSKLNIWYLDDATLSDSPETVLNDFHTIIKMAAEIGLKVNTSKCEIFFCSQRIDSSIVSKFEKICPGIRITSKDDLQLLGAPIFEEAHVHHFKIKQHKLNLLISRLEQINPHVAYFLLKNCLFIPKMSYFLRTCALWKFSSLLEDMDSLLKESLESILNICLNTKQWLQATLPISFGGLDIRRISDICLPAFLSSSHGVQDLMSSLLPFMDIKIQVHYYEEALNKWLSVNNETPASLKTQKSWDLINIVTKLLRKRSRWRKNSVLSPSRARKLARSRLPQPCSPNPPRNPCFFRPTIPGLRAEQSSPTATAASQRPRAAIEAIKGPRRACRAHSDSDSISDSNSIPSTFRLLAPAPNRLPIHLRLRFRPPTSDPFAPLVSEPGHPAHPVFPARSLP